MSDVFVCALYALAFVEGIYLYPGYKKETNRNDPSEIVRRLKGTCGATVLSILVFIGMNGTTWTAKMGMTVDVQQGTEFLRGLCVGAVLFLGPLVQMTRWEWQEAWETITSLRTWELSYWRNWVLAPVLEEIVFRGLICGTMTGYWAQVLTSCTLFSVAHAHHLLHDGRWTVVAVQLVYTFLFGWMGCQVLLDGGRLGSSVALHCFCNVMGLPDFAGAMESGWMVKGAYVVGLIAFFIVV